MKEQDEYVDESEYYDEVDLLKYDGEDADYIADMLFHDKREEKNGRK